MQRKSQFKKIRSVNLTIKPMSIFITFKQKETASLPILTLTFCFSSFLFYWLYSLSHKSGSEEEDSSVSCQSTFVASCIMVLILK